MKGEGRGIYLVMGACAGPYGRGTWSISLDQSKHPSAHLHWYRRVCIPISTSVLSKFEEEDLHRVRWHESSIILEEQSGGNLWHFAHNLRAFVCFLGFDFAFGLVLLEAGVVLADYSLYLRRGQLCGISRTGRGAYSPEFSCALRGAHVELSLRSARSEVGIECRNRCKILIS
jgi:hypothetical protein